jgi:hypothetical protein
MPKPSALLKQPDKNAETERTTETNSKFNVVKPNMLLSEVWLGFY